MNTSTPLDPRSLAHRLTATGYLLHHRLFAQLRDSDLHPRTLFLLAVIDGRVDAPWVAERLARGGKRVTALVERGWIVRTDDRWTLTDDGRQALDRAEADRDALLADLPNEQVERLTTALDALEEALGATDQPDDDHEGARPGFRDGFGPASGARGGFGRGFGPRGGFGFGPRGGFVFGPGARTHGEHAGRGHRDGSNADTDSGSRGGIGRGAHAHGGHGRRHGHGFAHDEHRHGRGDRAAQRAFERGFDAGFTRGRAASASPNAAESASGTPSDMERGPVAE